jgi:hypothetical protein
MALAFSGSAGESRDTGMSVSNLGLVQSATVGLWCRRTTTETRCPLGNNVWPPIDRDVFTFFYVSPSPWTRINTANSFNVTINTGAWGTDWTHLLATYNGSKYRLFINGIFEAEGNATGNITSDATNWVIGQRGNYTDQDWRWKGDVAELAFWNAVLTDGEIASLGKGFSNSKIRPQNLLSNSRLIRSLADVKGRSTASGSVTAAPHPRVYA